MLIYANDVNILGENLQTIKENTEIFIKASKDIGLEVNSDKISPYSAKDLGYRLYATLHKLPGKVGYPFCLFLKS